MTALPDGVALFQYPTKSGSGQWCAIWNDRVIKPSLPGSPQSHREWWASRDELIQALQEVDLATIAGGHFIRSRFPMIEPDSPSPGFRFREAPLDDYNLIGIGLDEYYKGAGRDDTPEDAASWMIEQLDDESLFRSGTHLHEFELWLFTHPVFELPDNRRPDAALAITRGVDLLRHRVERCKELSWPSGKVRLGLAVPWSIEVRYQTIYQNELPWTISLVMQNAFLGNPFAGERRPWRSPRAKVYMDDPSQWGQS